MEQYANSRQEEYYWLTDLVATEGWTIFKRIAKSRKEGLLQKTVRALRNGQAKEASDAVVAMDEIDKLFKAVQDRIIETKPKEE